VKPRKIKWEGVVSGGTEEIHKKTSVRIVSILAEI
jgi:hypothetical protein